MNFGFGYFLNRLLLHSSPPSHFITNFRNRNRKRLNNMILAVGPGTPACSLITSEVLQPSSDDSENESESQEDPGNDRTHRSPFSQDSGSAHEKKRTITEGDVINSESEEQQNPERSDRKRRSSSAGAVDDVDESKEGDKTFSHGFSHAYEESDGKISAASQNGSVPFSWYDKQWSKSSMRHGGCINAAAWITCPWRLSLAQTNDENPNLDSFIRSSSYASNTEGDNQTQFTPNARAVESLECPTQIITTGDDRLVKFWDASGSMGSISPIPCPTTKCPFSTQVSPISASSILMRWKKFYQRKTCVYGAIQHLATLNTGHNGNIFHVTTIPNRVGKIATCAADGCLHLSDVELQSSTSSSTISSTVVYKPTVHHTMSFSHHFLDSNTGLLCCDSGLLRFDLRLPLRSQCRESILDDTKETACRSCAMLSSSHLETENSVESAYVFGKFLS